METFLAFVWAPLLLYGLSVGLALLAERVLRLELPNALLAPTGLVVLVALVMPVYRLGGGSTAAIAVVLPCVVAGLVLAHRSLPGRLNPGVAGLAALAVYALYLAPVALTGHWTWPGYNFVNDTAPNFLFADLLGRQGVSLPSAIDSTTASIQAIPVNLGYPVGAHGLLASVRPLTGVPLAAMYHPVIAGIAGMAAMASTRLAQGAGLRPRSAAVAGALPLGAVLLYRYGLHGSIKELLVVAFLGTGAALAREALDRGLSVRLVVLIALCAASLLHVFSAVGAAYGLALGLVLLAVALIEGRGLMAVGRLVGVGVAIAVVAVAVNLSDVTAFAEHASAAFANEGGASTAYLGHLARPLPLEQVAGIWFSGDYRIAVPPAYSFVNTVCIVVLILAAVAGVVLEAQRRRPAGLLVLLPSAAVAAALAPQLSPYAAGKLLVVLSPAVVLMGAIGALLLLAEHARVLKATGGAILAVMLAGVLITDSLGYRETTLAPPGRIAAMEDVADHAGGGGAWLVNEWEEYAKYFMRDIKVNAAFEAESPRPAEMRKPRPIFGRYYDLDALTLQYVKSFPGIIKRRSPAASRPPANFELVYENDYYEAWRRRPSVQVLEHLPLQRRHHATAGPRCSRVRRLASKARTDDRLVAAWRPRLQLLDPLHAGLRPREWVPNANPPGTVVPLSPGRMEVDRPTPDGRFRVWIRGSFGRSTIVYVDLRKVGTADEINTPGQWEHVADIRLTRGMHRIELKRPGPSAAHGDTWRGELGPVAVERIAPSRLVTVSPRRATELCNRSWDWVELVRG
jgi:hypothetical protein